ncbi:MAG: alpha-L-rhamnosidase [Planctomycetes bacterium SM23_32]|nr:MAG: alpha-L-rhamnosidase [Planctomycetes bacterium SM23_32]
MGEQDAQRQVEQWGIFELALEAQTPGNPFMDVDFGARFVHGNRAVEAAGFYDGDGVFRVRFMPEAQGEWRYETRSDCEALNGRRGSFMCAAPGEGNHGPVRVADTFHFRYADGTPYYQVGTTCYAWVHQGDELEGQTLATLAAAPFNKLRMCVFPKRYAFNRNEPVYYPFERSGGGWDFTRFEPAFWRHLERRVGQLRDLGIEADIILFHPYDSGAWGFDRMDAASDDRYLRYVVARLAAYRNVWWSMANEWDFMGAKTEADFDRFFRIVQESDPYGHLRSVHNGATWYDHGKPWVTHLSVQGGTDGLRALRERHGKPVVVDECCYEGDIEHGWGNITARELVRRFWTGTVGGGYVGHGETYLHPEDVLWWSKGGVLHGESPPRIAFLRKILEEGPAHGFDPLDWRPSWDMWGAGKGDAYLLFYFAFRQPRRYFLGLPEGREYRVDLIDTWGMTVTPVEGTFSGHAEVPLPGRSDMAVRLRKVT